jgi:hypothetical protein
MIESRSIRAPVAARPTRKRKTAEFPFPGIRLTISLFGRSGIKLELFLKNKERKTLGKLKFSEGSKSPRRNGGRGAI